MGLFALISGLQIIALVLASGDENALKASFWGKHGDFDIEVPGSALPEWGSYRPGIFRS